MLAGLGMSPPRSTGGRLVPRRLTLFRSKKLTPSHPSRARQRPTYIVIPLWRRYPESHEVDEREPGVVPAIAARGNTYTHPLTRQLVSVKHFLPDCNLTLPTAFHCPPPPSSFAVVTWKILLGVILASSPCAMLHLASHSRALLTAERKRPHDRKHFITSG